MPEAVPPVPAPGAQSRRDSSGTQSMTPTAPTSYGYALNGGIYADALPGNGEPFDVSMIFPKHYEC